MVMERNANKNIFMGKAVAEGTEIETDRLYWGEGSWAERKTGAKIKAVGGRTNWRHCDRPSHTAYINPKCQWSLYVPPV